MSTDGRTNPITAGMLTCVDTRNRAAASCRSRPISRISSLAIPRNCGLVTSRASFRNRSAPRRPRAMRIRKSATPQSHAAAIRPVHSRIPMAGKRSIGKYKYWAVGFGTSAAREADEARGIAAENPPFPPRPPSMAARGNSALPERDTPDATFCRIRACTDALTSRTAQVATHDRRVPARAARQSV